MIVNTNNESFSTSITNVVVYTTPPKVVKDNTNYVLFKGDTLNVSLTITDKYGLDEKVLKENFYPFGISISEDSAFYEYFVDFLDDIIVSETNEKIVIDKNSKFYKFFFEEFLKKNKESYLVELKKTYDGTEDADIRNGVIRDIYSNIVLCDSTLEETEDGFLYKVAFNLGTNFDYSVLYNNESEKNNISFQCVNVGGTTLETPYEFTKNKFVYIPMTREEYVKSLGPVDIIFDNYFPENMFLLDKQPGHCDAIVVKNIESTIIPLDVVFELQPNSIGLIKNPYRESQEAFHQTINALTEDGYIIINGYYVSKLDDEELNRLLKNFTKNTATCGEWIKYSSRNIRKIETMPTAKFMDDTNAKGFAEYTKQILNSLYVEKGDTHRLSVLEKIGRINNFNNNDEIESDLISYNSYRQSVDINTEDVNKIRNHTNIQSSGEKLFRTILNYVPMINMYKGTEMAISAIVRALGIPAEVITKSYNMKYDLYDNTEYHKNDQEWFETDHFSLRLKEINWNDLKSIAASLKKIIIDNKPVPKVFEDFIIEIVGDLDMLIHHHGEVVDNNSIKGYSYALSNYLEVCTFSKAQYDVSSKKLILPVRIDGMKIFQSSGNKESKDWRTLYTQEYQKTYYNSTASNQVHYTKNIMNLLDKFYINNLKYKKNFTIAVLNDITDEIQLVKEVDIEDMELVASGNYYEFVVNDTSLSVINKHKIAIGFVLNPSNGHSPMAIDLSTSDNDYIATRED